jgi:hypothetical protein
MEQNQVHMLEFTPGDAPPPPKSATRPPPIRQ